MSAPAWPGTLPQKLLRDGFAEESPDNLIVSDMSVGPAKVRRRTTAAVRMIRGTLHMTSAQVSTFRTFVKTTIADRSQPFTFPDPYGGAALLVRMPTPYRVSAVGIDWRIDIELEVLP